MEKFEAVKLSWQGKDFVILPERRMGAIARIEDVLTIHQLSDFLINKKTVPLAKVAMAYASLLRWAGADATDEEVYAGMFADGDDGLHRTAIEQLYAIMAPPAATNGKSGKPGPTKRPQAASL